MSVSIVVGGQYGSEGKGKVALHLARERSASVAVRIGGPNSGHTVLDTRGEPVVFRQIPTAALEDGVLCVVGPGALVDPRILEDELERLGPGFDRLLIDQHAFVVEDSDVRSERSGGLGPAIGSTCSGTGAAVGRRAARRYGRHAIDLDGSLRRFVGDSRALLRQAVDDGERVVIEGTQGFGLSLLHSGHWPQVTSRDTTAAAALSETGLSPFDVDEIALVIRAHPIRVAGASGPFGAEEIDWKTVAAESGADGALEERTSVTGKIRRVARFDPEVVRQAIAVNKPSLLVLNHLDYVDISVRDRDRLSQAALGFVAAVEDSVGRSVDLIGTGPGSLVAAGVAPRG